MAYDRIYSLVVFAALLILTAFIAHPFFTIGQVGGHSAYIDLIRHIAWHGQVVQGEIIPRWIPDFYMGHGSPIFLYYAPASYVLIECFRTFTDSPAMALRLSYIFLIFLSLAGMYKLGRTLGGRWGGIAGAAVLGFAPYFLLDIYVRNGIAEFACFAILPWLFHFLIGIGISGKKVELLFTALLFALLITTHNITAMLTAPFLFLFALAASKKKNIIPAVGSLVFGMGLSAWFWLAALGEKDLVKSTESLTGGDYHFSNHFVYLKQLIIPSWGFGSSVIGPDDKMSFQVGTALLVFVLISSIAAIMIYKFKREILSSNLWKTFALFFAMFVIAVIFTNKVTYIFWDTLPLLPFVQFPWRFLLLASFAAAALASFIPRWLMATDSAKKYVYISGMLVVLVAFGASFKYVKARYVVHNVEKNTMLFSMEKDIMLKALGHPSIMLPEDVFSIENIRRMGVTTTSKDDYLPRTVVKSTGGIYYGFIAEAYQSDLRIDSKIQVAEKVILEYESKEPGKIMLEQFYFPGWTAYMDKKPLPLTPHPESGWMILSVPAGKGKVTIFFSDTPIRKIGKWISLIFGIGLILLMIFKRDPKGEENK